MYRARKPKSWWRTPVVDFLAAILYAGQVANWQRGRKGARPQPPKLPEDVEIRVRSAGDLAANKRRQSEHIRKRRAQMRLKRGGVDGQRH